jgi:hypothetical protein
MPAVRTLWQSALFADFSFNRPIAVQFLILFCLYNTHVLSILNSYGLIWTLAASTVRTLRALKI